MPPLSTAVAKAGSLVNRAVAKQALLYHLPSLVKCAVAKQAHLFHLSSLVKCAVAKPARFSCHHLSSVPLPSRLTCRPRRRRAGFPTRRLDPTRPASPPLRRAAVPFRLIVAKQANQARTASLREPPPLGVISVTPDGVITGKQCLDRQPRIARKRLGVRPPTPHRQKAAWRATPTPHHYAWCLHLKAGNATERETTKLNPMCIAPRAAIPIFTSRRTASSPSPSAIPPPHTACRKIFYSQDRIVAVAVCYTPGPTSDAIAAGVGGGDGDGGGGGPLGAAGLQALERTLGTGGWGT